eukprot:gene23033-30227_t
MFSLSLVSSKPLVFNVAAGKRMCACAPARPISVRMNRAGLSAAPASETSESTEPEEEQKRRLSMALPAWSCCQSSKYLDHFHLKTRTVPAGPRVPCVAVIDPIEHELTLVCHRSFVGKLFKALQAPECMAHFKIKMGDLKRSIQLKGMGVPELHRALSQAVLLSLKAKGWYVLQEEATQTDTHLHGTGAASHVVTLLKTDFLSASNKQTQQAPYAKIQVLALPPRKLQIHLLAAGTYAFKPLSVFEILKKPPKQASDQSQVTQAIPSDPLGEHEQLEYILGRPELMKQAQKQLWNSECILLPEMKYVCIQDMVMPSQPRGRQEEGHAENSIANAWLTRYGYEIPNRPMCNMRVAAEPDADVEHALEVPLCCLWSGKGRLLTDDGAKNAKDVQEQLMMDLTRGEGPHHFWGGTNLAAAPASDHIFPSAAIAPAHASTKNGSSASQATLCVSTPSGCNGMWSTAADLLKQPSSSLPPSQQQQQQQQINQGQPSSRLTDGYGEPQDGLEEVERKALRLQARGHERQGWKTLQPLLSAVMKARGGEEDHPEGACTNKVPSAPAMPLHTKLGLTKKICAGGNPVLMKRKVSLVVGMPISRAPKASLLSASAKTTTAGASLKAKVPKAPKDPTAAPKRKAAPAKPPPQGSMLPPTAPSTVMIPKPSSAASVPTTSAGSLNTVHLLSDLSPACPPDNCYQTSLGAERSAAASGPADGGAHKALAVGDSTTTLPLGETSKTVGPPRKRSKAADLDLEEVKAKAVEKHTSGKLKDLSLAEMQCFLRAHKLAVSGKKADLELRVAAILSKTDDFGATLGHARARPGCRSCRYGTRHATSGATSTLRSRCLDLASGQQATKVARNEKTKAEPIRTA